MNRTKELLEAALSYQKRGWSVFPINSRTRAGLVEWKPYQETLADETQIKQWWKKYPYAAIALATGKISNLIVLDVDIEEGKKYIKDKDIAPTPCVKTKRGEHYYFKHPGFPVQNFVKRKGLDLRGDGGYVVLPPSKHPSGLRYEWILSPEEELAHPPGWLLELITKKEPGKKLPETELSKLLDGVITGKRHDTATRLAGHYIGKGLASNEVIKLLKLWNDKNKPPLPENELTRMVEDFSLARKKKEKEKKKPISYQEGVEQGIQEALESVIDGQELKEKKFEPGQFWISDGLIPKKGVGVLASYKGRGKTSLALMAALQLSKGNCKFLNTFEIKESPQKILYWYGENQPEEIQAIRNLQEESINLNLTKAQRRILSLMPREKLDFVRDKQIDIVKGTIKELNPDIIIIDTLGWFLPGKKLNDSQTYFYLYDVLKEIKEDCFWLLITHNRKRSRDDIADEPVHKIAGSGALSNNAVSVIMIDRFTDKRSILYSKISFILTRGKPVEPVNTFFNEQTRCLDVLAGEAGKMPAVASPEDIRDLIKTAYPKGVFPKDIISLAMKVYKLNEKTIYNLLRKAKDKGLISQEIIKGKTKGNKYHAL